MKKLLMGVTLGALMSGSAFAAEGETVTGTVNVDGERDCVCELTGFNADSLAFINFGALGTNGEADVQTLAELGLFCNLPSDVTLESINGFLRLNTGNTAYQPVNGDAGDFSTSAASDFAAGLDYSASINGTSLSGDTSAINAGVVTPLGSLPAVNQSGLSIDFDTIAGSLPLIAGDYSDTLILSITPVAL